MNRDIYDKVIYLFFSVRILRLTQKMSWKNILFYPSPAAATVTNLSINSVCKNIVLFQAYASKVGVKNSAPPPETNAKINIKKIKIRIPSSQCFDFF